MTAGEIARAIVAYWARHRGAGHTQATLKGIPDYQYQNRASAVVIARDARHAQNLRSRTRRATVLTIDQVDKLEGIAGAPLVVDHYATAGIFMDLVDEIKILEDRIDRERRRGDGLAADLAAAATRAEKAEGRLRKLEDPTPMMIEAARDAFHRSGLQPNEDPLVIAFRKMIEAVL